MSFEDRISLIVIATIIAVIVKLIEALFIKYYSFVRAKVFLLLFAKDLKIAIQENKVEIAEASYNIVLTNYPDFNSNLYTQDSIAILLNFYNKLMLKELYKSQENQEKDISEIRKVEKLLNLEKNIPFRGIYKKGEKFVTTKVNNYRNN